MELQAWVAEIEQRRKGAFANAMEVVDAECRDSLCRRELVADVGLDLNDALRSLALLEAWQ